MRSAERGPTPGICRSCATKSRSAAGYSVFLIPPVQCPCNASPARTSHLGPASCSHLPHRHFGQIQRERFEATEIQLQRRVFLLVRPARLLKFGIRFSPAFLAIEHDAVPKTI